MDLSYCLSHRMLFYNEAHRSLRARPCGVRRAFPELSGLMKRRAFMKIAGLAGAASLLDASRLPHASAEAQSKSALHTDFKPFGIASAPNGYIYATDPANYRVVQLDKNFKPAAAFGRPGATEGMLNYPLGVDIDPDGLVYVVDSNNCRVQVFQPDGKLHRVIGSIGSIGGSFATPQGIHVYGQGNFLVADTRNHRIQIYENLELKAVVGDLGDDDDQFRLPSAALMSPVGEIFVLDGKHGKVKVFGKDLKLKRSFGEPGSAQGKLRQPQDMDLDERGRLWLADTGNHRIQLFDQNGKLLKVIGGPGTESDRFNNPTGIVCGKGVVYVADNVNGRVVTLSTQAS